MEKNEIEGLNLLKAYQDGYNRPHSYYGFSREKMPYVMELLEKYKNDLPTGDISFITNRYSIEELSIICDRQCMPFDKNYCVEFLHAVNCLYSFNGKYSINKPEWLEYYNACTSFYRSFDRALKKNPNFNYYITSIINDLITCNRPMKDSIRWFEYNIFIILCGLTSYVYYYSLDINIIKKAISLFIKEYKEIIDYLTMNGIHFHESEKFNEEYFKIILMLMNNYKDRERSIIR